MQSYVFLILLLSVGAIIPHVFFPQAYAYLDPGSGTAIIYVIISGLVGLGITFKVYWHKIKTKILSKT